MTDNPFLTPNNKSINDDNFKFFSKRDKLRPINPHPPTDQYVPSPNVFLSKQYNHNHNNNYNHNRIQASHQPITFQKTLHESLQEMENQKRNQSKHSTLELTAMEFPSLSDTKIISNNQKYTKEINTKLPDISNKVKQYTPPTNMDNMRQNSFIKSPTQSSFTDRTNPPMNTFLSKEPTYNNNFNNNNNDDYIEIIDKKDVESKYSHTINKFSGF